MIFWVKNKNIIIACTCCAAFILGLILWNRYQGTKNYLNTQMGHSQQAIMELFSVEKAQLEELAHAMLSEANANSDDIYYYAELEKLVSQGEDTQSLLDISTMLQDLSKDYKGFFDKICTVKDGNYAYPENTCVFTHTVMRYCDVYCWVDLVFTESAEMKDRISEYPLAENLGQGWYLVIRYGY